MTDARLTMLEEKVADLRVEQARTAQSMDHLAETIKGLTGVVQDLRDSMNRGRGALWIFGIMAATVGGLVSWATTLLFRQS